jgi:hypothetical protein
MIRQATNPAAYYDKWPSGGGAVPVFVILLQKRLPKSLTIEDSKEASSPEPDLKFKVPQGNQIVGATVSNNSFEFMLLAVGPSL